MITLFVKVVLIAEIAALVLLSIKGLKLDWENRQSALKWQVLYDGMRAKLR